MANQSLFSSTRGRTVKKADTKNAAGGVAYTMSTKAALARYAATGCLSNTYYTKAEDHLDKVIALAEECDSEFIAKLAVFTRKQGHMKDMPALLMSILACRGELGREALELAFPQVIDNGKMVRNFIQIMRSGKLGRKSLGTRPKKLVQKFLEGNAPVWVFRQLAVGQDPSGADIIKMMHPKATTPAQDAFYGYMIGKVKQNDEKWGRLPSLITHFEDWKRDKTLEAPRVPFELLTAEKLDGKQWAQIFRNSQWHFIKNNLNTAIRQGALKADPGLEQFIADRLRDKEAISKARVMPYQILAAYVHASNEVPRSIIEALHDAVDIAVDNVPEIEGNVLVIVDVSYSMRDSITGRSGKKKPSKVRCVDVAALFSAAIARKNPRTGVLPVDTRVHLGYRPEPRNTILSEAKRLADFGGGGTNLSLGFDFIIERKMAVDSVIIISDQESWADKRWNSSAGTALMQRWEVIRSKNRKAKLLCIDIQPGAEHQIDASHKEILCVSGWNDSVFKVAAAFNHGDADSWLSIIDKIDLTEKN